MISEQWSAIGRYHDRAVTVIPFFFLHSDSCLFDISCQKKSWVELNVVAIRALVEDGGNGGWFGG
jgi:hypothetical protein